MYQLAGVQKCELRPHCIEFTNTKPLEAPAESGYHMAGR